jgi:hypothetical protein
MPGQTPARSAPVPTSWRQHAAQLAYRRYPVRHVIQHVHRQHRVKRAIAHRQRGDISAEQRRVAVCDRNDVVRSGPGQLPAGWAGARPVSFSLISHNFLAAASSRAAADGSRRWRLT